MDLLSGIYGAPHSVLDLAQVPGAEIRPDARRLLRWLMSELYCLLSGPEKERARDVWQLRVLGLPGKLDFTGISQRWLREAVKWWAAEDLPCAAAGRPPTPPGTPSARPRRCRRACAFPATTPGTTPPRSAG